MAKKTKSPKLYSFDEVKKLIQQAKQEVVGKVLAGKICLHCGAEKEKNLMNWCVKCLEEE